MNEEQVNPESAPQVPMTQEATPAQIETPLTPPESSIGSGIQVPESVAEPEPVVDQERLGVLAQEVVANGGQLTEQHYAELSEAGFGDKGMVDQFFAGQMALRQQQQQHVYNQLGGQQKVEAAMSWAAKNLDQASIDSINADLASASLDGQARILQSLIQQSATVTSALKAVPSGNGGGVAPYGSLAEFYADVAKPEYKADKAFAQQCQARLAASNVRVPTK